MRLIYLSEKFYDEYGIYPEILSKKERPYACLKIRIGDLTFAVPFRHHISHKYAFITLEGCGLDYSKSVVIKDDSYIDLKTPQIDKAEYNLIKGKDDRIRNGLVKYIKIYLKAAKCKDSPHYKHIFEYSTLKYFEEYLSEIS